MSLSALSFPILLSSQVKQDRMLISNFALHIRAVSESAVDVESNGDMTW
jgi:hypothetical protein